jgi:hypothetical protein
VKIILAYAFGKGLIFGLKQNFWRFLAPPPSVTAADGRRSVRPKVPSCGVVGSIAAAFAVVGP